MILSYVQFVLILLKICSNLENSESKRVRDINKKKLHNGHKKNTVEFSAVPLFLRAEIISTDFTTFSVLKSFCSSK